MALLAFRKHKRQSGARFTVLDVGTAKVVCFIAQSSPSGEVTVRGVGHQLSKGIRGGIITDVAEAQTSMLAAVAAAEQMSGDHVERAAIALTGGGVESRHVHVEMSLPGEAVAERDILDVIDQARSTVASVDAEILHCLPMSYALDAARGIADPRHMMGKQLSADVHVITAASNVTRNLSHCVARAHMEVEEFVLASHASGLACLEPDEMDLGVTLVDMGAGATGFSIYHAGRNVYADVIPVGGLHVTQDVARGLGTTVAHAERLKTLHGSCLPTPSDDQVMISAPLLGESEDSDEANVVPRAALVSIVRPRVEELMEMIRARIDESGMSALAGRRVVLTGGASQLIGARELAARILARQVRLGKPRVPQGLAEAVSGPAFSCALGMLKYITQRPMEEQLRDASRHQGMPGLRSVAGWLKESF